MRHWSLPTAVVLLPTKNATAIRLCAFWLAGAALLIAMTASLANAQQNATQADTSEASRQQCLRSIPRQQLSPQAWAKIQGPLTRPSLYRRLPIEYVPTDPDMYLFLIRYPEVVTNIWELMGVTNLQITRTGATTFTAVDGGGSETNVELVYASENLHIWYGEGVYRGPVLKRKINGRCVGVLHTGFSKGTDGKPYASSRLDVFLSIDDLGGDIMARSLGPAIGATTDANFHEAASFLSRVSEISEQNGPGVERMADRLNRVQVPVRQYFAQLAATVHQRARIRQAQAITPQVAPTQ